MIFISIIFTGCSDSLLGPIQDKTEKENLKEATVTLCFPGSAPYNITDVITEIEKETEAQLNMNLDYQWLPIIGFSDKIEEKLDSGEDIDAIASFGHNIKMLYEDNRLMDIKKLLYDYGPKLAANYKKQEVDTFSDKDFLYALPSKMPFTDKVCVVVKKDLVKKYNIDTIKTWDDFDRYLSIVKKNEPEFYPFGLSGTFRGMFLEASGYVNLDSGFVYDRYDPDMKLIQWERTNAFKESLYRFKSWIDKGYLTDPYFMSSDLNKVPAYTDYMSWTLVNNYSVSYTDDFIVFPINPEQIGSLKPPILNSAIAFNKYSRNPERTMMFLNWIYSKQDNFDLFLYGIKDKNYTLEDGKINTDIQEEDRANYFNIAHWINSGARVFLNTNFLRVSKGQTDNFWENYSNYVEKTCRYAPHIPFIPKLDDTLKKVSRDRLLMYTSIADTAKSNNPNMVELSQIPKNRETA